MRRFVIVAMLCGMAATWNARADEGFMDLYGVRLHYVVAGQGPPVVLIHGYMSSLRINWQRPGILSRLALHYQVIAFDLPGHGQSDRPTAKSQYGTHMIDQIILMMDRLHVAKADVVGYSLGGMIALKMAVLHPNRVRRVILGDMGWLTPGVATLIGLQSNAGSDAALRACYASWPALAVTGRQLNALRVPLAVVIGEEDRLVRHLYVDPLHRWRPDVPIAVVPGAGHFTSFMKPEFIQAVERFLAARR